MRFGLIIIIASIATLLLQNTSVSLVEAKSVPPPTVRLHSYFCLSAAQSLCLGISSDDEPEYDPHRLFHLQVKRRTRAEAKGLDFLRMRWFVDREEGVIQMSNFTSLCAAKASASTRAPGAAVLRPCGTHGELEVFNLNSFMKNVHEEGQIRPRSAPHQCLAIMQCTRVRNGNSSFCDPNRANVEFMGEVIDAETQRGSFVKFVPCRSGAVSQTWRQALDCAPGCSPYMLEGEYASECNPECNNRECNWDNGACNTPAPTRPTKLPASPPITPLRPADDADPDPVPTSRPSSPPTLEPSVSSTFRPSPASSPPSVPPTSQTHSPTTNLVGLSAPIPASTPQEDFTWLWALLASVLSLLACCFFGGCAYQRRQRRKQGVSGSHADKSGRDLEKSMPELRRHTVAPTAKMNIRSTAASNAEHVSSFIPPSSSSNPDCDKAQKTATTFLSAS